MKKYTSGELKEILELHKKWLNNEKEGVRASLNGANLNGASLNGASLNGANLNGASLNGVFGNLKHIKTIQCEKYYISYTSKVIQIGCQGHTIEEWKNFDDEKISKMDNGALEWWNKWKPVIIKIIEMSPAEDAGCIEKDSE